MSIVFTDRRTGNQIMLKGVELTPKRLASNNLGLGTSAPSYFAKRYSGDIDDLHKVVPHTNEVSDGRLSARRQKAIFDDRVPPDLRNRILDLLDRTDRLPDGMRGGTRFNKARNDLAAEIFNRVDLPAKLQRGLLKAVLDNPGT